MMSQVNPFESHQLPSESGGVVQAQVVYEPKVPVGIWKDRRLLVMHKHATLPDICVKSNTPCQGRRLKRNMYWHHPALFLTVLLGVLVYAILAVVIRKNAVVWVPLSEEWWARRRRAIAIGWGLALLGFVVAIGGPILAAQTKTDWLGFGVLAGIGLMLTGMIYGASQAPMVSPKRIDDEYVWLKGVHPAYVAALPDYPYGRR
ncbi:MAG: hypothetical protein K8T91_16095 [Planctomycetes bacterium]|nr:hypothetical protein [Planctomycetota bacterium]